MKGGFRKFQAGVLLKEEFRGWLKSLKGGGVYHIGQFFSYYYGKPFFKSDGITPRKACKAWFETWGKTFADIAVEEGFHLYRDMQPYGFLLEKR